MVELYRNSPEFKEVIQELEENFAESPEKSSEFEEKTYPTSFSYVQVFYILFFVCCFSYSGLPNLNKIFPDTLKKLFAKKKKL
jgi:hypothetical protein